MKNDDFVFIKVKDAKETVDILKDYRGMLERAIEMTPQKIKRDVLYLEFNDVDKIIKYLKGEIKK